MGTFKVDGAIVANGKLTSNTSGARLTTTDGNISIWFGINTDGTAWGIYNTGSSSYIVKQTAAGTNFYGNASSASRLVSRGNVTAESGTAWPAVSGLSMSQVYTNGYPTNYGNLLTMYGGGASQLLIGWSETSGACAPAYIRSKRDVADANWSSWQQLTTTDGFATSAARLYSSDSSYHYSSANPYYMYMTYSDPYWDLKVSPAAPQDVRVSKAFNADNADMVDGHHFHWSGQSGQPSWLWGGNDPTNMYVYNPSNFNVLTSKYPYGFASFTSGAAWGNTTGTSIASWNDPTGGSVDWRQDNPSAGKVSMKVDGRVYVNEGTNPVLSSQHANGYWGMCSPDGENNVWIRTTIRGIIPYQSGGHGSIGSSGWPFSEGYFKYLNVTDDASNTSVDALAYFRHYNNNDWTVKVDSGSYDYGLYVINAHTATNAFQVNGGARISNTVRIGNGTALDGNYCEGLRIRAANGQWATIIMGATADTGTNEYAWSIHRTNGNNFAISRNSADGGNGLLINTSGYVGIGTTGPSYRLHVAGDIYADGGWFRVSGNNGLYWESHGVHLTRNTVSSYGGLRICGGAIGGYEGLHFGSGTSGMTIMNIDGSHQGLYNESGTGWIVYNHAGNGRVGIGDSHTVSGYKVTLSGNTYNNGVLTMNGQINLRINGGSWYNPIKSPADGGLWYDASSSTSSTYLSMMALKFANTTFSIGGERAGNVFGIYSYANTRNNNGYDGALYVNGNNHYFYCTTRLYGAVWNDYAEYRGQSEEVAAGYCVTSNNKGQVSKTTQRMQYCEGIVSDTYGFAIGETNEYKTPLAVSGRVMAYCEGDRNSYNAGDIVCASENGKVCHMTREEAMQYPERIVGTVSEIPTYETWGTKQVAVDGRIWIKIK